MLHSELEEKRLSAEAEKRAAAQKPPENPPVTIPLVPVAEVPLKKKKKGKSGLSMIYT